MLGWLEKIMYNIKENNNKYIWLKLDLNERKNLTVMIKMEKIRIAKMRKTLGNHNQIFLINTHSKFN